MNAAMPQLPRLRDVLAWLLPGRASRAQDIDRLVVKSEMTLRRVDAALARRARLDRLRDAYRDGDDE